jgi:hypothetical protein
MNGDLPKLATTLQGLFGPFVDQTNEEVGWVERRRTLDAPAWVHLLVFGWIGHPLRCFADLAMRVRLSAQALQQRLNERAVRVFRAVFHEAVRTVVSAQPPLIPLARRFPGIVIDDSTQLTLPPCLAELFPACGGLDGKRGKASWKLRIRYDASSGQLEPFDLLPGKTSDRDLSVQPISDLKPGVLYLADLGYFSLERLRQVRRAEAHYITRLPARLQITGATGEPELVGLWLKSRTEDRVDEEVCLGRLGECRTRLVALRVPANVAAERRRKRRAKCGKRGRVVSANQEALCDWWVAVTDLAAAALTAEEVRTLYRLRWQVELLFKHWKQAGGLGTIHGRTAESVQVEYLAKLIGVLVTHWQELLGGGPLAGKNRSAVHRWVVETCERIAVVLRRGGGIESIIRILEELARRLRKLRPRSRRKKAPSARQLVYGKRVTD